MDTNITIPEMYVGGDHTSQIYYQRYANFLAELTLPGRALRLVHSPIVQLTQSRTQYRRPHPRPNTLRTDVLSSPAYVTSLADVFAPSRLCVRYRSPDYRIRCFGYNRLGAKPCNT